MKCKRITEECDSCGSKVYCDMWKGFVQGFQKGVDDTMTRLNTSHQYKKPRIMFGNGKPLYTRVKELDIDDDTKWDLLRSIGTWEAELYRLEDVVRQLNRINKKLFEGNLSEQQLEELREESKKYIY